MLVSHTNRGILVIGTLAHEAEQLLTPEVIKQVLQQEEIYGKNWLINNLNYVFERYIRLDV